MSGNWKMQPPPTPAKGEAMPQTPEYWEKRALMDQERILEQKAQISLLKSKLKKALQRGWEVTDEERDYLKIKLRDYRHQSDRERFYY